MYNAERDVREKDAKAKWWGLGRRSNHKHKQRLLEMPRRSLPSRKSRRVEAAVKILGLFGYEVGSRFARMKMKRLPLVSAVNSSFLLRRSARFARVSIDREERFEKEEGIATRVRVFLCRVPIFVCSSTMHEYVHYRRIVVNHWAS